MTSTSVSRIVPAKPEAVYEAFMDPDILLSWLPPAEMTGQLHRFDPSVGGGYRMSLFYPPSEQTFRGKTAEREDRMDVRFVELAPPRRLVQAVNFLSDDPAYHGEMTMTWTYEATAGGTEVSVVTENLPPGLRPQDNAAGSRLSLDQLVRLFE
jgi:uncharacterized protein YndB with AHSA1/START domain